MTAATYLGEAEVRDARLHDARHTAATVLLLLGVQDRAVMDFMGWSSASMKLRYMHVTEGLRRDVPTSSTGTSGRSNETLTETLYAGDRQLTTKAAGQSGADAGTRTPNLPLTRRMLCQLSYVGACSSW